ncbi:DNA topoisomerase 2-binding protein 1-A-like [Paramacrobiotus metropolitanus]|uniref:DNA topoisomerase 2-binding protein 1-A-like n=1 Tax=Paramacrobiotus metropolitanus TaxID=2943436 RepID=UPI002445723B|nr:DNA topoisomerase 2-binding protein 1-A-like [Paramacrobiotus metropolitanus]
MEVDINPFCDYRNAAPPTDSGSCTSSQHDPLECQDEEDESKKITDMRIVQLENPSIDDRRLLDQVYEALQRGKVSGVRWIREQDLLSELQKPNTLKAVFVLPKFEGNAFDLIRGRGCCNIYGPRCILSCLENEWPLPIMEGWPVANMALRKVEVCCSNMAPEKRNVAYAKVAAMGGKARKQLVDTVTHLVTPIVGSPKYFAALRNGKYVVRPEWVEEMWRLSTTGVETCNKMEILYKHQLDIFQGLEISVSQLDTAQRCRIKRAVTENGGTFTSMLNRKSTKILLSTSNLGDKCQAARKWKIAIVNPKWVDDSVGKGYCLDWAKYLVEPTPPAPKTPEHVKQGSNGLRATSTPNHGAKGTLNHSLDISAIPQKSEDKSRLSPIPEGVLNAIILAEDTVQPGPGTQAVMRRQASDEENMVVNETAVKPAASGSAPSNPATTAPEEKGSKPASVRLPVAGAKPGVLPLSKRILNLEPDLSPVAPKTLKSVTNELRDLIYREKPVKPAPRLPKVFIKPRSIKRRGRLVWSQAEPNPFKHPRPRDDESDLESDEGDDRQENSDGEIDEVADDDVQPETPAAVKTEPSEPVPIESGTSAPVPTKQDPSEPTSGKSSSSGTVTSGSSVTRSSASTSTKSGTSSGAFGPSGSRSASSGAISGPSTRSGTSASTKSGSSDAISSKSGSTRSGMINLGVAPSLLPAAQGATNLLVGKQKSAEEMKEKTATGLMSKFKSADQLPKVGAAPGAPNSRSVPVVPQRNVAEKPAMLVGKNVEKKPGTEDWDSLEMDSALLEGLQAAENVVKSPAAKPMTVNVPPPPPPEPVFCFSGLSTEAEKRTLIAAVMKLGGKYIDSVQYEPGCTHLLIKVPTRNEKFLAYAAAGRWILHMQYIQDSLTTGHFLPEEMYEWGNMEKAASINTAIKANDLAAAGCHWRRHVKRTGQGAFAGWKVVLVAEAARAKGYARVLQAGGAVVLTDKAPYAPFASTATHLLQETKGPTMDPAELARYKAAGVSCHAADYLAHFLCNPNGDVAKGTKSRPAPQDEAPSAKRMRR